MKKLTIIFYLFLIPLCVFAQNESSISHTKTVNDSTLIKIHAIVEDIDFRMHGLDRYKLYPTENIYNFLQLDTMTGKIKLYNGLWMMIKKVLQPLITKTYLLVQAVEHLNYIQQKIYINFFC